MSILIATLQLASNKNNSRIISMPLDSERAQNVAEVMGGANVAFGTWMQRTSAESENCDSKEDLWKEPVEVLSCIGAWAGDN